MNEYKANQLSQADKDYLTDFIRALKMLNQSISELLVSVKNIDSSYIFCSNSWRSKYTAHQQYKTQNNISSDRYDNSPDMLAQARYEDQYVINNKSAITCLKILRFSGALLPFYCVKSPIINHNNDHVLGIFNYDLSLKNTTYMDILQNERHLVNDALPLSLTCREKQIIFLFLSHLSSQEIADIIGKFEGKKISKNTIDSFFRESLYEKFNVYSRPELYRKLIDLGYMAKVPKELLTAKSKILDNITVY